MRKILLVVLVGAVCLVIYRAYTLGGSSRSPFKEQPVSVDSVVAGVDTSAAIEEMERTPEEPASAGSDAFLVLGEDVFQGENSFTLTRYVRVAETQPDDSLKALLRRQYRAIAASHEQSPSRLAIYLFGPDFRMGKDTSQWAARLTQESGGPVRVIVKVD